MTNNYIALLRCAVFQVLDDGRPGGDVPYSEWRFNDPSEEIANSDRVDFADKVAEWLTFHATMPVSPELACCEETPCQWGDHPCARKKPLKPAVSVSPQPSRLPPNKPMDFRSYEKATLRADEIGTPGICQHCRGKLGMEHWPFHRCWMEA